MKKGNKQCLFDTPAAILSIFCIKLLHANVQFACIVTATYQTDPSKAAAEVGHPMCVHYHNPNKQTCRKNCLSSNSRDFHKF